MEAYSKFRQLALAILLNTNDQLTDSIGSAELEDVKITVKDVEYSFIDFLNSLNSYFWYITEIENRKIRIKELESHLETVSQFKDAYIEFGRLLGIKV